MKILVLHLKIALIATIIITTKATSTESSADDELAVAAQAQLQRLAPFRRSVDSVNEYKEIDEYNNPKSIVSTNSNNNNIPNDSVTEIKLPISLTELFRVVGKMPDANKSKRGADEAKQIFPEKNNEINDLVSENSENYYYADRLKRTGLGIEGKTGSGSGTFLAALAGQAVGSVIGASAGASRGSSSGSHQNQYYGYPAAQYGPPVYIHHQPTKDGFNLWDFKKAIFNTVLQAAKAVGGTVLALKGSLIKGGGYLISTKGKVISGAGSALSGLGKSLAASAVVANQPTYAHGYTYEAPTIITTDHGSGYDLSPPQDSYSPHYGAASDVLHQPGLKPISGDDHHISDHHISPEHLSTHDWDQSNKDPHFQINSIVNSHDQHTHDHEEHSVESVSIPPSQLQLNDHNQVNHDLYPPIGTVPPSDHDSHHDDHTHYVTPLPNHGSHEGYKYEEPDTNSHPLILNDYHTIKGPHIGIQSFKYLPAKPSSIHHPDIQIEISDGDITGLEHKNYPTHTFPHRGFNMISVHGPVKIPILKPNPYNYWKRSPNYGSYINPIRNFNKPLYVKPPFELHQSHGYKIDTSKLQRI